MTLNINALVLDDLARQKMGNTNVNMYMLRQLPMIVPSDYESPPLPGSATFGELVWRRAVGLAMRSSALTISWRSVSPVVRDTEPILAASERAQALAELDALYAHLYGLTEADLRRILEPPLPERSFAVLRRRELEEHGRFVTAERVLSAFTSLSEWACV